jgi:hypothetical protein
MKLRLPTTLAGQTTRVPDDLLILTVLESQMSEDAGGGGSSSFWRTINEIMVNVLPKPMSSANIPPARTRLS